MDFTNEFAVPENPYWSNVRQHDQPDGKQIDKMGCFFRLGVFRRRRKIRLHFVKSYVSVSDPYPIFFALVLTRFSHAALLARNFVKTKTW